MGLWNFFFDWVWCVGIPMIISLGHLLNTQEVKRNVKILARLNCVFLLSLSDYLPMYVLSVWCHYLCVCSCFCVYVKFRFYVRVLYNYFIYLARIGHRLPYITTINQHVQVFWSTLTTTQIVVMTTHQTKGTSFQHLFDDISV